MDYESLLTKKYIFLGGKGGVGKTSTSCSIALSLSSSKKRVLLISTDPAHNLSDAFGQKFSNSPTQVNSTENLFCLEVNPEVAVYDLFSSSDSNNNQIEEMNKKENKKEKNKLKRLLSTFPGIDEAITFHMLLSNQEIQSFDVVVFDTAPTGHTLKFLSLPQSIGAALEEFSSLKSTLGPLLDTLKMLGGEDSGSLDLLGGIGSFLDEDVFGKIEKLSTGVEEIKKVFTDEEKTTFICVAIPEFMSLYETERLIQGLNKFDVNSSMIVINQIVENGNCKVCERKSGIHKEFLEQFEVLYEDDFRLVKIPVMEFEVRGKEAFEKIGKKIKEQMSK